MKYDYKCNECNHIWEVSHSIKVSNAVEELGLSCENCNSQDIQKYLGNYKSATIMFKGQGFVVNDTALERIGMPEAQRNSPYAKKKLKDAF